jgi:Fe-S-cluster containining protein
MAQDGRKPAGSATADEPWFAGGLRFECQPGCGACCTNHDDYAYVYLADGEVEALAAELELPVETFRERYTALDEGWTVLRMDTPACPFLDGTRCRVYRARPGPCRTFPFWPEGLSSPRAWRRLATFCPGINRGERHSLAVIRRHLNEGP